MPQHDSQHSTKKPVTTMLTYPWKCTVLHCNHLGNARKPLVLMTRHFDYCPSASEGDNQSVRSSAPVVSRCFPGGYNVKLYISRGRLAWWLLAFLHSANSLSGVIHHAQNGINPTVFPLQKCPPEEEPGCPADCVEKAKGLWAADPTKDDPCIFTVEMHNIFPFGE